MTRLPGRLLAVSGDAEAKKRDCYLIASLILGQIEPAVDMARQIEAAGLRVLGDAAYEDAIALQAAGAEVFTDMAHAPRLLGL